MRVRLLSPLDAAAFHALRIRGLRETPSAFASSAEEEEHSPLDSVATRLGASHDQAVFGAFHEGELVGIVGLQRESLKKLSHKAFIWGMYVAPESRRRGAARELVAHALLYAQQTMHARQVNLGVNTLNTPAVKLYKEMGFVQYGLEKAFLLVDGELHDEYQMVCHLSEA